MKKLFLVAILCCGCTNARIKQITAFGHDFKVTLYSGGQPVRTWTSDGKVATEEHSDGWYFMELGTGKLIRVSGSVAVEQVN